ncbi:MAG: Triacylglycerol lipase precursor [bacterium]|nr:Triacylglycerol lipase precursor [bacterium]
MAMTPAPPPPALLQACTDAIADVYTLPTGLPAFDLSHRGDVIRCGFDRYLSPAQINAAMTSYGYKGPTLPSGAWLFRYAYRTQRIAAAGSTAIPEGVSSGILLVPDQPQAGGPLVVFAHASVGIGPSCAPSILDLTGPVAGDDHRGAVLGLAGYGWTLMVPDYAGFGYGEAPGWSIAEDEAHSVLDSTRAAKQLVPSLTGKVVFVGHSQGGHAVLAADSYAPSYGMEGELIGVAAYAPLWLSAYAWAGIIAPAAGYKTSDSGYAIMYDLDYFYSHGEMYDGPGGGLAMIQPAKRDAVKSFLMDQCSPMPSPPGVDITTLGATPTDFFDNNFIDSLSGCGIGFGGCTDATAMTWTARFSADRPPIDPNGPPLMIFDGGMDANFPPPRAQCMFDKLDADLMGATTPTTKIATCFDPDAQHFDIMRRDVDYANQWIAARAGIGPEPTPCTPFPTGLTCQTPPPNL